MLEKTIIGLGQNEPTSHTRIGLGNELNYALDRFRAHYKVLSRADWILQAAKSDAEKTRNTRLIHQLETIQLNIDLNGQITVTGNWNDITVYLVDDQRYLVLSDVPSRIAKLFNKLGICFKSKT